MLTEHQPGIVDRFFRYVKIDTQSDPASDSQPSTEKQKDLGKILVKELKEMQYQNDQDYFFDSSKFDKRFSFTPTSYKDGIAAVLKEEMG